MSRTRSSLAAVALLAVLMLLSVAMPAVAQEGRDLSIFNVEGGAVVSPDINIAAQRGNGKVSVIVKLATPPSYRNYVTAGGHKNKGVATAAADAQAAQIRAEQASFTTAATALGGRVTGSYQFLLNAVVVEIDADRVLSLAKVPGVVAIGPNRTYERAHTTSLPLIRASEVWEGALTGGSFTGEGVVVAVIDEGIDYSHAHFGGEQNYADNDPLVIGETGMEYYPPTVLPDTSAGEMKVIGGTDFVGDDYDAAGSGAALTPQPDEDPMGCDYSHGTHVAGSVAGYGVTTSGDTFVGDYTDGNATLFPSYPNASVGSWRIGPGVAPEAYLVSLRVFGCNGSTGTDVLLASFEEAATKDYLGLSVNVVNMSLGSAYGGTGPDDFLNVAQEALADMGIVVVASAGNSGDFQLVNGAPSSAKTTISVANITDSAAIVDGQLTYVDPVSTNTVNIAAAKAVAMYTTDMPDPLTAVIAIADVANGCSPLANDYTGKWVIVDRGVCGFSVKVESVKNANGLGAIIANNAPGAPFSAGQTAGFDDQLPTMMISQADGVALKAAVNAGLGDVSGTFDGGVGYALTEVALVPNASTSRGGVLRGSNDTILKPNISGPGTSITSAGAGTNNLGYTISGTSMSAPHIAGAVALLIEASGSLPDELDDVTAIKQRLMNTATVDVRASEVATVPYQSPQRVGAGFADLVAAVNTELVAYSTESPENVSLSFGYPHALVNTTPSITKTITVENWSASAMTLATAYSPRSDWGGAAFSVSPAFVSVPANSTATVNVTLSLFPSQADLNVGGDPLFVITGKSILHEESGYVTLTPTSGNQTAIRVPVYAAPHITSDLSVAEEAIINGDTGSGELVISGAGYSFGPDFNDHLSLVSAFTLLAEDGEETGLFWDADGVDGEEADEELVDYGYADVNYVGANLTSGANTFLDVAVVMHDAWTSPRDLYVEVYLDLDDDGTDDYVWFYGAAASDVFNTSFSYIPDGRSFSFNTPLNFGHGASLDSMLFKNNVMVVPTIVSSGSFTSLGFPNWDGVSPIGVEVVTYQRDSDFTFEIDVVEGEYTKDIAFIAPGRALYAGLDGNVIPFTYDVTGLDPLPQILTIHHQNHDMESRSQVTSLAQITGTSFNLVSPANGAIVRDPADVTAATWTELEGATLYTFTLTKLSVNTGVRTSGDQTIVTATAADDGDLLTCAAGTCTLDLTVVSLEDGVYSWVVVAGEAPNLIEASNNAYGFVVESDDLSLLLNGSFEDQGAKANKAANWAGKGVRKLGTTTVPALDGTYVLSVPVKGTAKQTLTMVNQPALAFLTTGQVLDFDLSTSRGKGKLAIITLKYTDGTSEKCTLGGVTNTAPLTDWEAKALTCPVNKPVSSIIVVLRHSGGTQTQPTQYDAVSLVAPGAGGPRGSQLPLPTAPDGFRGNN